MLKIAKYSSALLMISIGLAAGITSMALNIGHGLEASISAAITCGLADFARCSVPVIAATRGWNKWLKRALYVLIAFSLWNISNYIADQYGRTIWTAMQDGNGKASRAIEIDALKAQAEKIAEKASVQALKDLAESEAKRKGCGPDCMKIKGRIPEAERREKIEAEIAKLVGANNAVAPLEVEGFGVALVAMGMTPLAAKTVMLALKGFGTLVVVDMLVYFLIPGFAWIREDRMEERRTSLGLEPVAIAKAKDGAKKVSKAQAYREVTDRLLAMPEGSMLTSHRQLAQLVGVPKSTFTEWMKEWHATGKLLVAEKDKRKTLISLPKAA